VVPENQQTKYQGFGLRGLLLAPKIGHLIGATFSGARLGQKTKKERNKGNAAKANFRICSSQTHIEIHSTKKKNCG